MNIRLSHLRSVLLVSLLVSLAACERSSEWTRYELAFGLSTQTEQGRSIISEVEWQDFVDREILPRFRDGFTLFETQGYWQSEGESFQEPSRILMIVAKNSEETRRDLKAIANRYLEHFGQEAVLMIQGPAEVSFLGANP